MTVPALLGPGAELAQALGALPGTFDPLDLVACALAVVLGGRAGAGAKRSPSLIAVAPPPS
jgi:hypothetical protein